MVHTETQKFFLSLWGHRVLCPEPRYCRRWLTSHDPFGIITKHENVGQPPSAVPSGCTAGGGGATFHDLRVSPRLMNDYNELRQPPLKPQRAQGQHGRAQTHHGRHLGPQDPQPRALEEHVLDHDNEISQGIQVR